MGEPPASFVTQGSLKFWGFFGGPPLLDSMRVSPVSMQASGQGHGTCPQKATEDPGRARSPGVHSGKDDFENYSG